MKSDPILEVTNCYLVTDRMDLKIYVFADSFAECERRMKARFEGMDWRLMKIEKLGEGLAPMAFRVRKQDSEAVDQEKAK
jgi:hypothetical protein